MHAEVRTGGLFELARYDGRGMGRYPLELVRVPKIGASISNAELTSAGSICLYLKIDGVNYALTCQHVVTPEDTWGEKFTAGNGKDVILQPSKEDLEDDETELNKHIKAKKALCDNYSAEKLKYENGEGPRPANTDQQIEKTRDLLQILNEEKATMESGIAEVSLPLGTLTFAPGISPHPAPGRLPHQTTMFRRDWALIKLSEDRFPSLPPNIVSYFSELY